LFANGRQGPHPPVFSGGNRKRPAQQLVEDRFQNLVIDGIRKILCPLGGRSSLPFRKGIGPGHQRGGEGICQDKLSWEEVYLKRKALPVQVTKEQETRKNSFSQSGFLSSRRGGSSSGVRGGGNTPQRKKALAWHSLKETSGATAGTPSSHEGGGKGNATRILTPK